MMIARACLATLTVALVTAASGQAAAVDESVPGAPAEWSTHASRDEIRPQFRYMANGGHADAECLMIEADDRKGLAGWWSKSIAVEGGRTYRFSAWRKTDGIKAPRRAALVRVMWSDGEGQPISHDEITKGTFKPADKPASEPEYPTDHETDADGWTEVADTYRAPSAARQAVVELHYRWAPAGRVTWSDVSLVPVAQEPRIVRLATVHYQPHSGTTPDEKRRQFAPLVDKAAEQKADLVVLPETLTYYGTGMEYVDCAEPVPGPSTEFFGELARQHDLYIVAGILERDKHLVYNVAILMGPDGKLVGKYRKVCLPRLEIEWGVQPGDDYPVFETRFGKVGMMICYDGFVPEPARELTRKGAEVIAFPVWGCNPLLAAARACENHVYVVSSTFSDVSNNWMRSAVYAHDGRALVAAENWGDVVVAEVDLSERVHWSSLGDFKAELVRHRPLAADER